MEKIKVRDLGNLFKNKVNHQTKIDLKSKQFKKYGIKPEDLLEFDITEQIKKFRKSKESDSFEDRFESKWRG